MRFLHKVETVYSRKKTRFDCKNNYKYSKLANFQLDIISKFNCKRIIVI